MVRRLATLLLAVIVLLPLAAFTEQALVMAGYEEKDTFRDWSNNLFFERMQQRTGVAFTFQQLNSWEDWQQAKANMLAGAVALPEVLFKAGLTPAETLTWLEAGLLIDLAPLLEQHAPNLWRLLEEHADMRAAITLPDGRIGALPFLNLEPTQNALWINRKWLSALKLQAPESPEELMQVLLAFKDNDPNQNGRRDEKPLSFIGPYDLKYLTQGFGLVANDFNMFERDGQAMFLPLEPGFEDYVKWLVSLRQQGLMDRDSFYTADALRLVQDAKGVQTYGAFLAPLPSSFLPTEWAQDYVVVAPFAHQGQRLWRSAVGRATPGTFALTTACSEPERMLEWVDYLYTQEGATLATNGLEGVDYLVDGDGTWRMTDVAQQQGFLAESTISTGAVPPGVSNQGFQARSGQVLVQHVTSELEKVAKYAADPFPPFSLTAQQEAEVGPMQQRIGKYVDEAIARFALGEWEATEAQFATFRAELEALGVAEFTAFWQRVLEQHTKEQP